MASSSLLPKLLLPLLPLLLLSNNLAAQRYANITRGTTFTPLERASWPSPSGNFAFGFTPLETDPTLFLLAVWFDKTPNKTVVWTANGANPVTNQSKAELTPDGQLSLKDGTGREIWNPNVNTAAHASMLDTGNLVMSSADAGTIWQSFDHPTDTLLPGQVVNPETNIFARLADEDYSRGRFVLTLQDDGNLVLYSVAYPTAAKYDSYWSTETAAAVMNSLVFNASTGSLYLSFPNGSTVSVFSAPADVGDSYLRATLDPDGVFRQYSFPKSSKLGEGSWTANHSVGSDVCNVRFGLGSGACGFNSYCIANDDGRYNCLCPPHYSFIDPTKKFQGCKPDFAAQICEPGGEALFSIWEMINVDWPLADGDQLSPVSEDQCKQSCLKDCFCYVAIYGSKFQGGSCWKKKFPLSNGKKRDDVDRTAFIKFSTLNNSMPTAPPPSPTDSTEGKTGWKTWELAVSALLGGSVVLHLVMILSCCFVYRRIRRPPPPPSSASRMTGSVLCSFTYKELEEATNGFSEEVGRGAFGTVYKGALPSDPSTPIAVKKLEESLLEKAEKDFANEVTTIGQTHHKNLVRLLGFCKEGAHRLLVFEFMSNGPLNRYLFGPDKPEWTERVQIALGIAEGLAYLHELCGSQIIHCDIKPQNILLDGNRVAKISDFGMAKLLRLKQTQTRTFVRGTIGYFAPEWFKNVAITAKVDVYSFGVLLLEIVSCRKSFEVDSVGSDSVEAATLLDRAKECYRNRRLDLLVDGDDAVEDGVRVERLVMVAISCIQDEPWLRPSMKKVVQMLEGTVPVSVTPDMCSVYNQQAPAIDGSPDQL